MSFLGRRCHEYSFIAFNNPCFSIQRDECAAADFRRQSSALPCPCKIPAEGCGCSAHKVVLMCLNTPKVPCPCKITAEGFWLQYSRSRADVLEYTQDDVLVLCCSNSISTDFVARRFPGGEVQPTNTTHFQVIFSSSGTLQLMRLVLLSNIMQPCPNMACTVRCLMVCS